MKDENPALKSCKPGLGPNPTRDQITMSSSTVTDTQSWYFRDSEGKGLLAAVVTAAMDVLAFLEYPDRSSKKSKRTYGDRWKFGMLVLKEFLDLSDRDLVRILPSLRGVMEAGRVERVPHHTTLRKYSKRVPEGLVDKVIGETARILCGNDSVIAVDATGFSESNASKHFVKRLKAFGTETQRVRDFAKATLAVDVQSKAIAVCDVATSHTADVKRFVPVSEKLKDTGIPVSVLLADKGYDAEYIHLEARRIFGFGISTQIPARNCKSPKAARQEWRNAPNGYHRRMMDRSLDLSVYRFRSIVETVNSMLKRKMGETVYGKTMESVSKEIRFTALAHNLRLILEGGLIRY